MYERILIPLDGSKMGEAALPYIEGLISKLSPEIRVEVTLLQVVSSLTHYIIAGEASAPAPALRRADLGRVFRGSVASAEQLLLRHHADSRPAETDQAGF